MTKTEHAYINFALSPKSNFITDLQNIRFCSSRWGNQGICGFRVQLFRIEARRKYILFCFTTRFPDLATCITLILWRTVVACQNKRRQMRILGKIIMSVRLNWLASKPIRRSGEVPNRASQMCLQGSSLHRPPHCVCRIFQRTQTRRNAANHGVQTWFVEWIISVTATTCFLVLSEERGFECSPTF